MKAYSQCGLALQVSLKNLTREALLGVPWSEVDHHVVASGNRVMICNAKFHVF